MAKKLVQTKEMQKFKKISNVFFRIACAGGSLLSLSGLASAISVINHCTTTLHIESHNARPTTVKGEANSWPIRILTTMKSSDPTKNCILVNTIFEVRAWPGNKRVGTILAGQSVVGFNASSNSNTGSIDISGLAPGAYKFSLTGHADTAPDSFTLTILSASAPLPPPAPPEAEKPWPKIAPAVTNFLLQK
jgi:hypothetical protein